VQDFLSEAVGAVVLEEGAVTFDLERAKYSVSGEYNKCLLHLWSAERNTVRRVLDAEVKSGTLRLHVQRLGQSHPTKLEICRERDRRSPSAKRLTRLAYQHKLRRALERHFPDFTIAQLTTGVNLKKSFGPIYCRGLIKHGQSAFAVLGVNEQETQSSIDAALTFGILWLDICRHAGKFLVEGLKLFVPHRSSDLVRERMANLNRQAAKWNLYELEESDESLAEIDCADRGNVSTRLVHAPNEAAAQVRFSEAIVRIQNLLPNCEVAILSAAEIAFRWRGLEFARTRIGMEPGTFRSTQEIVFGVGVEERVLDEHNERAFSELVNRLRDSRHPYGPRHNPLWRMHPERWLESLIVNDVGVIDERFDSSQLYSQIPAFTAADRAMIDVLTNTRDGRLAVVELKAGEDIHLPLQGLDYWSRVSWHHERGEFLRFGYFPGRELSVEKPLLFLVAPALHVHPAMDILLRYISPEINWEFVGIDERWREGVKVVFRKRPDSKSHRAGMESQKQTFELPLAN
jgi:hypothetical protein